MQQYYYTYGNEDILSGKITVIKDEEIYTITFIQETFNIDSLEDITSNQGTNLISKVTEDYNDPENLLIVRTITLKLIGKCNPRPETLFKIYS